MAFTDNFTDTTGTFLENHIPSGGTAWTLLAGGTAGAYRINTNQCAGNSAGPGAYTCDNQGSADQYTQALRPAFSSTQNMDFLCVRLQDVSNFIGHYLAGTGASGRRLAKVVAGTVTDLITSQGVSGEWMKVTAQGTTIQLYAGGTGGTPSWTQVGTNQTVTNFSTQQTQGLVQTAAGGNNLVWDTFEAGSLSTGNALGISSTSSLGWNGVGVKPSALSVSSVSSLTWNGIQIKPAALGISSTTALNWNSSVVTHSFGISSTSSLGFVSKAIHESVVGVSSVSVLAWTDIAIHKSVLNVPSTSSLGWVGQNVGTTIVKGAFGVNSLSSITFNGLAIEKSVFGISSKSKVTFVPPSKKAANSNGWTAELGRKRRREMSKLMLIEQEDRDILELIKAAMPYLETLD